MTFLAALEGHSYENLPSTVKTIKNDSHSLVFGYPDTR